MKKSDELKQTVDSLRAEVENLQGQEQYDAAAKKSVELTDAVHEYQTAKALEAAEEVYENKKRKVPTARLNEIMLPIVENMPPPATKGKYIKIKYVMQLPTPTPQFACFVNLPQYIKDPYRRFLENKIREEWDFSGVPIQIYFRQK